MVVNNIIGIDMRRYLGFKNIKSMVKNYFSIFIVLIIFFIVFTVSSGYYYYRAGVSEKQNIIVKMTDNLTEHCTRLDAYIEDVFTKSYVLSTSDSLIDNLRQLQNSEDTLNTIETVNMLKEFKSSVFDHIFKVFLYSPDHRLYYNDGVTDAEIFFQELYYQENFTLQGWEELAHETDNMQIINPITIYDKYSATERVLVSLISPINIQDEEWLLVTQVNMASILNQLSDNRAYDRQEFVCIDSSGGVVFNTTGYDLFQNNALPKLDSTTTLIEESYRITGKTFLLVGRVASDNLSYYTLIPQETLADIVAEITEPTLIFLFFSMMIFFIITIIYVRQIYKPFKSIVELSKRIEDDGEKGYFNLNRLEMIGNVYRNKEIAIDNICEYFINQMVAYGENTEFEGFQDIFLANCRLSEENLYCISLKVNFTEHYYESFDEEEQGHIDRGLILLLERQFIDSFKCYVIYINDILLCYYNSFDNEDRAINTIIDNIESLLSPDSELCGINLARSNPCSGKDCVFESTAQALTTLEYMGNMDTPLKDYNPKEVDFSNPFTLQMRNRLIYLLQSGNKEDILSFVINLDNESRAAKLYYPLYKKMYTRLVGIGREYFYADKNIAKADEQWKILTEKHNSYIELNRHISNRAKLCNFLQLCSSEQEENRGVENVEVIVSYIKNNLANDIYLDKVAKELELSPRYVANIIKEKTGFTIGDYIARVRIAKAKELIWDSDENVTKIGEMVGFDNRITFFRTFKKHEGVSPTNYRKSKIK